MTEFRRVLFRSGESSSKKQALTYKKYQHIRGVFSKHTQVYFPTKSVDCVLFLILAFDGLGVLLPFVFSCNFRRVMCYFLNSPVLFAFLLSYLFWQDTLIFTLVLYCVHIIYMLFTYYPHSNLCSITYRQLWSSKHQLHFLFF